MTTGILGAHAVIVGVVEGLAPGCTIFRSHPELRTPPHLVDAALRAVA